MRICIRTDVIRSFPVGCVAWKLYCLFSSLYWCRLENFHLSQVFVLLLLLFLPLSRVVASKC